MRHRHLAVLAIAAALGAPAIAAAQAADTSHHDKPVTPGQVAKNTESESKRVANRTGKVARKAGKQTAAQSKRTAKAVKKVYSRKARREARGDTTATQKKP